MFNTPQDNLSRFGKKKNVKCNAKKKSKNQMSNGSKIGEKHKITVTKKDTDRRRKKKPPK